MCARVCSCIRVRHTRPRVHDASVCARAWARCVAHEDMRGVWCTRARVCTALHDLARACGCAPPVSRECVYVGYVHARASVRCVCGHVARVYVNPCVGDDALQTRVKSRGGREFLCAPRPVLPSPPPSAAQQPSSPRSRHPTPWSPSHHPVLPLAPGLQPWGRFESGSRWMRGKGRERCTGNRPGG